MKEQIKEIPRYKTEKVQIGVVPTKVFVAEDGKEFREQFQCERYERDLKIRKNVERLLIDISNTIPYDSQLDLINILGASKPSGLSIFKFKYPDSEEAVKYISDYFELTYRRRPAFGERIAYEELFAFCWTEDEDSDYPYPQIDVMSKLELKTTIHNFVNKINESIKTIEKL